MTMTLDDFLSNGVGPKPYLSVSQLRDYLTCPAYHSFRSVERLTPDYRKPYVVARGKAAHKVAESALTIKMDLNDLPATEALLDAFSEAYDQEAKECGDDTDDPGQIKDQGVSMVRLLAEQVLPTINPIALEQRVEFELAGVPFVSVLDVVEKGGVADFKFVSKSPSADTADKSIQLTAYHQAYRTEYGSAPEQLRLIHLVPIKSGPKAVEQPTKRTDSDVQRLEGLVAGVWQGIQAGVAYPNLESWRCPSCEYRETCRKRY